MKWKVRIVYNERQFMAKYRLGPKYLDDLRDIEHEHKVKILVIRQYYSGQWNPIYSVTND